MRWRHLPNRIILRRTGDDALTAFYTKRLVDPFFAIAGGKDGIHRTACNAGFAADKTILQINIKRGQRPTCAGRTSLFLNMSLVFIPEILKGCQYRVGCGFTQSADRAAFYIFTQIFQEVQIFIPAFTFGNPVQYIEQVPGADPAKSAFAAGLVLGEIKKIPRDIHHAGKIGRASCRERV